MPHRRDPLAEYMDQVGKGEKEYTIRLNQEQRAAMLALHDNGVLALRDRSVDSALNAVTGQLKDQIWP